MMRVLSLGAGVQSSTLAMMISHGEIEMVDAAIFVDTQWESRRVYEWLDWLEARLPFPVHRVTRGSLRESIENKQNATGQRFASIPWFTVQPDGSHGMGRRQCTREFKIEPLLKEKRRLLGLKKGQRAPRGEVLIETLIGISTDEMARTKNSEEKWNVNRYPLIERRMSRTDCLAWMASHSYPTPPKSSCIGCPYHSTAEWLSVVNDPEALADVLTVDNIIREPVRGMNGQQFMNDRRIPMGEFIKMIKHGHRAQVEINLFQNECEGMCGV